MATSKKQASKKSSSTKKAAPKKRAAEPMKRAAAQEPAVVREVVSFADTPLQGMASGGPERPRTQQPEQEGIYVYGIIEVNENISFGKTTLGGSNESVYTVHYGDVAA